MGRNGAAQKIALTKAGEVSAELARRGIAADARARVLVEVVGGKADRRPWPPSLRPGARSIGSPTSPTPYTDADLVQPRAG